MAPVASSAKMRGRLTIFAFCGAASGTSMTSMLKSAVFVVLLGLEPRAARELLARAHRCRCPSRRRRCATCPSGRRTSVCVCEPRQVCTAATWRGLRMSLMSKMRTPRKRSLLTVSGTPCVPQSTRPRVCSTDMNSRLP